MFELAIKGDFASAHSLRGYQGPCEELHGHTWKVEVTFVSAQTNDIGLVVDFREIRGKLKEFLGRLDHGYLNDLDAFKTQNPSTENLAKFIFEEFSRMCHPYKIKKVQVWESDHASVTYYE